MVRVVARTGFQALVAKVLEAEASYIPVSSLLGVSNEKSEMVEADKSRFGLQVSKGGGNGSSLFGLYLQTRSE